MSRGGMHACMVRPFPTQTEPGGDIMPERKDAPHAPPDRTPPLRLEPEKRMCPLFDPASIAEFPVAAPGEMGYRVVDNFCEEHIQ